MADVESIRAGMLRELIQSFEGSTIRSIESLPPDPDRLIFALRQIGYSLEQAVSDLVDNSINAGARTVLIRFVWQDGSIRKILIADDGAGMTYSELQSAMRFGSDADPDPHSLGKFGMGLKLASFSYARELTVVSRRNHRASGRRWTVDRISDDWSSEILNRAYVRRVIDAPIHSVDMRDSGTVVIWEQLDKLPPSKGGLRYTLRSIHRRLQLHLGLCFHRFIEDDRVRILVDQQELGEAEHHIQVSIPALDPFKYPKSGRKGYPRLFNVRLGDNHTLNIEGHVWPPNSESLEYRLGNRAAARQGFYFYRNDRLIQAGGWNGMVQSESEPHSSLARVKIDMPAELDALFSLNVQKSSVIVPPGFIEAAMAARGTRGVTFEQYRHDAQEVYRKKDTRAGRTRPLLPGTGIPRELQRKVRAELHENPKTARQVDLKWVALGTDELFQMDQENRQILLNSMYRADVLCGFNASGTDVPLFKMLVYFLLEADMDNNGSSSKRKRKLELINRILVQAVELGKG